MADPNVLAVIPARGGSKRLPRKNIVNLRGHPLIAYTIKAAQDATKLTDWLVSTDDEEIAEVARAYGAAVPFMRPAALAGDNDRNSAVVRHAMEFMEAKTGRRYDIVMLLQPTCPIRSPAHIDEAIELLWASPLDTLASVKGPIKKRDPYIKAVRGSALVPYNPQEDAANWEGCYTYNAAIYAMKRDFFLRENAFVSQNSVPLFMDRFFSADIDEEIDAKVAELYFDYLDWAPFGKASRSGSVTALPDPVQKILLSKVSDLDDVFESPEVRASVAAFAPSYVLVALPKSSSTYSTQVLGKILGATVYQDLVTQDRCTPKDISLPGLINARDRATISQLHLTATGANLRILRNFRIPTVILLRSLFDVVVSLRDHMNSNPYFSSVLIPKDFAALSESDKLDYIIDTAVPWIITLYTSWVQAIERGDAKAKFVYFEDLVRDPAPFFASICEGFGRPVTAAEVERGISEVQASKATRFNVGRPGRGMEQLSSRQVDKIRRHVAYYPGIDFSPLGL